MTANEDDGDHPGPGRPPFVPTLAQRGLVETMAGCGIPEADIALVIDISPKTVRKHFRQELDTGHIRANAKVAGNLFRIATGSGREAVTAAIFWLKCQAEWSDRSFDPDPWSRMGKKERAYQKAREPDFSTEIGRALAENDGIFPPEEDRDE